MTLFYQDNGRNSDRPEYANQTPIFVEYQGDNHYVPLITTLNVDEVMHNIRAAIQRRESGVGEEILTAPEIKIPVSMFN